MRIVSLSSRVNSVLNTIEVKKQRDIDTEFWQDIVYMHIKKSLQNNIGIKYDDQSCLRGA